MESRQVSTSFTVFGSILTFMLQVILAPNIAIFDVVPNFILVFVVLNAMVSPQIRSCFTGFFLGFLYDCVSHAALGTMSFVLTIIAYVFSSLNKDLFSGGWVIQAFYLLIAAFFGELLHATFLSILGVDTDFLVSLGMRVLPGTLYDALFGLIVFPLMARSRSSRKRDPGLLKGKYS